MTAVHDNEISRKKFFFFQMKILHSPLHEYHRYKCKERRSSEIIK